MLLAEKPVTVPGGYIGYLSNLVRSMRKSGSFVVNVGFNCRGASRGRKRQKEQTGSRIPRKEMEDVKGMSQGLHQHP